MREAQIREELRKMELARVSKSVADLIRSEGPNYRANRDKINCDQIMTC